jgi:hypothetical protein
VLLFIFSLLSLPVAKVPVFHLALSCSSLSCDNSLFPRLYFLEPWCPGPIDGLPGFQSEQHPGRPHRPAAEQPRLIQRTHGGHQLLLR